MSPVSSFKDAGPMKSTAAGLALLILAGLLVAACSGGDDDDADPGCSGGFIEVTVTLPMFSEFACSIGGEYVNVQTLMPLEGDPHSYVPPEEDSELISDARLVLYAGLDTDKPLQDYIFMHGRGSAQLIGYTRSITSPTAEQPPQDQPEIDAEEAGDNPYLWLDPQVAAEYIDATRDSLQIVDSDHNPEYREAAERYIQRLGELQAEIVGDLQAIPSEKRKLITLHNSMEHLARRFGFEVTGFLTAPGETPSEAEIAALAETVEEAGVPAIFTEVGYDTAAMQQVAAAAGVELCSLYTDRADAKAYKYEDIMRANAEELSRCLGGS
jgi:zinc transport system substrate-binding protein